MKKRNKWVSILIMGLLTAAMLAGCGEADKGVKAGAEKTADEGAKSADSKRNTDFKMAMISSEIGSEEFNLSAYNAMMEAAEEYGFDCISIECTDTTAWEENIMAVSQEEYDLVVGVGWNTAEPIAKAADQFSNVTYAVIDTICKNDRVTSITFREEEGAYVEGIMLATAFPKDELYGYVCSYQTQATYKYRYGYEEGIKAVNPDAKMIYNYVNSYTDTSMVYEYAMQQKAAGCNVVIGGISSAANNGIYQACLELGDKGTPIYTTGLSVDQTTKDNPYILGGLLKNTGVCMTDIIVNYIDGTLKPGEQSGGLKEGMFGVVFATTDGGNYLNEEIFTEDVIQAGKYAVENIISGEIKIIVPEEASQS